MINLPKVPNPYGLSSGTTSELGKLWALLFTLGFVLFIIGIILRFRK
jgi:hypothetical protein